ncbi:MAG: CRISPR-associated endoribonuclease Cas6, partial [Candidatus Omnitrophica bacterium]|nr:CRISPR-associated endoribonuclease Cas6 [Candidatus Omnitrophota bacterium]
RAKPFTFSVLFPRGISIERETFYLSDNIELEDFVFKFPKGSYFSILVASTDYEFLMRLYNGLLDLKEFPFNKDITISIARILPVEKRPSIGDKVFFRTLSPILIEGKDKKPIFNKDGTFDMDLFNKELNQIQDRILNSIRGEGLKRELVFKPLDGAYKKQVVKHTLSEIMKGYVEGKFPKPYLTFTCFEGCFKLEGDLEDLNILYDIGIGLRTGQGFGMVEVINSGQEK